MPFVRKGVIPAAGLGTRFLPATKALPKEMLPIVDKPLIQFAVEEAIASGIEDLVFVTGRGKHAIEDHFDRSHELEAMLSERGQHRLLSLLQQISGLCRVAYTRQKRPDGLGDAILSAKNVLGDAPFAVLLADDLLTSRRPVLRQLIDVHAETGATVVGVQRLPGEELSAHGVIDVRATRGRLHEVAGLVEKPRPGKAPSELAVVGRYVLVGSVHDHIERVTPGERGEIQLTDALNALAREKRVVALELDARRYDCGTRLGYIRAIVEQALEREDLAPALEAWLATLSPTKRGPPPATER